MNALFPVQCDFKLHFRQGKFFLILPFRRPPKKRFARIEVEAIDPGVRVPFTVYSPEGSVIEVQQTGFGQTFAKHRQKQEASESCSRTGDG